jgi:hypothetical protein
MYHRVPMYWPPASSTPIYTQTSKWLTFFVEGWLIVIIKGWSTLYSVVRAFYPDCGTIDNQRWSCDYIFLIGCQQPLDPHNICCLASLL